MPDEESMKKLMRAIKSVKNTRSSLENITPLMDFIDNLVFSDSMSDFRVIWNDTEWFGKALKYNGAIKYDGKTINDTIWLRSKYDGSIKYNGTFKYNEVREVLRDHPIRSTFKYSSRTTDNLDMRLVFNVSDNMIAMIDNFDLAMRYHHKFNGQYKYNGSINYDSTVLKPLGA
jgi:hypothetical protein